MTSNNEKAPSNRGGNATATGAASAGDGGGIRVATAEFSAGAARANQVPKSSQFEDAPEIAFAGRSNVGKSSLLNMLLARKGLARTSNTPGCTKQINFFDIGLAKASVEAVPGRPQRVIFVDLPGYGYAKVSKTEASAWKALLEGYLHERPTLRAVVILVDVRRGIEQEEEDLIEFLAERPGIAVFVAATKVDKLSLSAQKPALAKLKSAARARARGASSGGERNAASSAETPSADPAISIIATSGETGAGRELLWARILDACRVH